MHVVVSATSPMPRDVLFAWWTDYEPDDHAAPEFRHPLLTTKPREVDKSQRGAVLIRDRGTFAGIPWRYESRVTFHPPDRLHEESHGPYGDFETDYVFIAQAPGTRVIMDVRAVHPLLGLAGPLARWLAAEDLRRHLSQAEREWREKR